MTESALPGNRSSTRRRREWAVDIAIAFVVTGVQLAGTYANPAWGSTKHSSVGWDSYLLLAVAGLVLVLRRRFPVTVLAVSLGATLAVGALGDARLIWIAPIVAFFTAEMAGKRLAAAASLVIGYLASWWPPWRIGEPGHASVPVALGVASWLLVLLAIAELIRIRHQRAVALQRTREEQFLRRASEDRMRIARDLHDVLAHNISVINVQANTALHLMDRQPDRAREALTAIHGVSKQALAELRTVLGVLRDSDTGEGGAPRAPSPGLTQLPDLLVAVRSAGLDVRLTVEGQARALPADADIAVYRIVQESLTNTTRHSTATAAAVLVRYEPAAVLVLVADGAAAMAGAATSVQGVTTAPPEAGREAQTPPNLASTEQGTGSGIAGMADRVHELGGTFEAGPAVEGGFVVTAWLPVEPVEDQQPDRVSS
jgi:signal transduction histidine kinase